MCKKVTVPSLTCLSEADFRTPEIFKFSECYLDSSLTGILTQPSISVWGVTVLTRRGGSRMKVLLMSPDPSSATCEANSCMVELMC